MLTQTFSAALHGVDAVCVEVEVNNTGAGDEDRVSIVGLPDAAVRESRERVRSAIYASGYYPPRGYTMVNLAPADLKKEGSHFDLAIAVGMVATAGSPPWAGLKEIVIAGELGLNGTVRPIRGALAIALRARASGKRAVMLPADSAKEAGVVQGIQVIGVENLRQAIQFLTGERGIPLTTTDISEFSRSENASSVDFSEIKGQHCVKRGMEIAAAGGHNLLMIGPPGAGKTMLAQRLSTILPPMSLEEALETTTVHSVAGQLPPGQPLVVERPFRAPHHTISDAGLLGGQSNPRPGEVSLAHNGVLFLDELPEYKRSVLEVLRQPLESGKVTISRAAGSFTFPANFQLVAAMNPCPCGHHAGMQRQCRCGSSLIERYRSRISGPLLDRIDLHVEVSALSSDELMGKASGETSAVVRQRVLAARDLQQQRFADSATSCNAGMAPGQIQDHCQLDKVSSQLLRQAINDLDLSARAYDRILRVARTIADLAKTEQVDSQHISEAVQYRSLDRKRW